MNTMAVSDACAHVLGLPVACKAAVVVKLVGVVGVAVIADGK